MHAASSAAAPLVRPPGAAAPAGAAEMLTWLVGQIGALKHSAGGQSAQSAPAGARREGYVELSDWSTDSDSNAGGRGRGGRAGPSALRGARRFRAVVARVMESRKKGELLRPGPSSLPRRVVRR